MGSNKKDKMPKVRHTWGINPCSRVAPSKKRIQKSDYFDVCPSCIGKGQLQKAGGFVIECSTCEGTGLV